MKANIQTRTAGFTTAFATMDENSQQSLVVMAKGSDLYLCTGVALANASDALSIRIPDGTGIVLEPAPIGPVHLRMSTDGPVSYWFT